MCIAQDRRFKKSLGKAGIAVHSKSDRLRLESTFKHRAFHLEPTKAGSHPIINNSNATGFHFSHESFHAPTAAANELKVAMPKKDVPTIKQAPTIDTMPSEESSPSNQSTDEGTSVKAVEDTPAATLKELVNLKPRVSIFQKNNANVISSQSRDELLTLRMVKSFDEDRKDDEYSLIWTSDSTRSLGSEGRIKVEFDFGRGAPSKRSPVRPEPLKIDNEEMPRREESSSPIYKTPEVSFRNYEDIPTPPTPRHSMSLCHFDRWTPPAHLLLPTFCME